MTIATAPSESDEKRIVILVRGIMNSGGFYWCFVAVKPELVTKFQKELVNKYNIQNFVKDGYGAVIVSGKGRTPPDDILKQLETALETKFTNIENDPPEVYLEKIVSCLNDKKYSETK